jgi:hypothetical protein
VIEAVFKRTRVTVALMSSAKLLSAVEPIIRYQRGRFRGSEQAKAGMLRYELGLQQRQDALHRLASLWAIGEAGASLGFAAARLYDELDSLEREKNEILDAKGVRRGKSELKFFRDVNQSALELLRQENHSPEKRKAVCYDELKAARGPEPDGRIRDHGGLSRLPRVQVDGHATGSHLRRAGSGAAA